jgi:hypothetical protein
VVDSIEEYLPLSTSEMAVATDGSIWRYQPNAPGGIIEIEPPTNPPPPTQLDDYLPFFTAGIALSVDGSVWRYQPNASGGMVEIEPPRQPTPPTNTVPPSIIAPNGLAVGQQAVMNSGTWQNSPTFTREWTSGGTVIPGDTGPAHTFQASDVGNMIGGSLTGTNQDGSLTVPASNTVGPVIEPPLEDPEAADLPRRPVARSGSQRPKTTRRKRV